MVFFCWAVLPLVASHSLFIVPNLNFSEDSSVLDLQLTLRLHFHQWPFLVSHSAKSPLLSMTPSCLQSQCCVRPDHVLGRIVNGIWNFVQKKAIEWSVLGELFCVSYTIKFSCQCEVQPWPPLEHSFRMLILRKHFPGGSCLKDACPLLTAANFSA